MIAILPGDPRNDRSIQPLRRPSKRPKTTRAEARPRAMSRPRRLQYNASSTRRSPQGTRSNRSCSPRPITRLDRRVSCESFPPSRSFGRSDSPYNETRHPELVPNNTTDVARDASDRQRPAADALLKRPCDRSKRTIHINLAATTPIRQAASRRLPKEFISPRFTPHPTLKSDSPNSLQNRLADSNTYRFPLVFRVPWPPPSPLESADGSLINESVSFA